MKNALRNKTEARPHRDVKKRRQRHTASLQQQEQLQQQTGSSYTSRNTRGTPHSINNSSDAFSSCSPTSDPKKLPSPANNSINAINERISRLSMGNQLPNSKLPRRLQPSQSQQARLIPISPLQARATKSETTINKGKNVTRCISLQDEATTMARAAIEIDRQCLRKQNNGNFHSIWRARKNHRKIKESDKIHNEKNIYYVNQTISGNDHLVEAAQSRLKNLLLAQERQLDMHEQLKQTFGDIVDQEEENGTELIHQLRVHLDQQALHIQDLERALALERSRKGDFRRKFETEKQALLEQQQEKFDALKSKYRMGLELIVDRWLSNEAAEQEIWMDQIRQQADDRVALVEERWMERAADLQAELRQYRDQNFRNIVE